MMTPMNVLDAHGPTRECITIGTVWIINLVKKYSQNMQVNISLKTSGQIERSNDAKVKRRSTKTFV